MRTPCRLVLLAASLAGPALARDEARLPGDAASVQAAAADKPFKLSIGEYRYGGNFGGQDLNLRYRRGDSSVWLGPTRSMAIRCVSLPAREITSSR